MEKKRAVIYCRVSTKEQAEEGNSLITQEKICKEYAHKNGYDIVSIFIEEGESAKTQNRTKFQELLSFCRNRKNKINAVIAYKIDRISRNTDDYSQIRLLLKSFGVEIKSTSEFFENTPVGKFMENVIANVAQFDNDVRTERSVGGMREAMHEGRYVWIAPLGYSNIKVNDKSTIAQNELAPFVRKIFETVAKDSHSVLEIRRMVNEQVKSTHLGKCLSKAQYFRLLRNKVYAGWIIKFGEQHKGLFEPIVTQELFDQAQRVLRHRSHRTLQYVKENPDFPLRRFVKSPEGYSLTGGWSQGRTKKYAYYRFIQRKQEFPKTNLETLFKTFINQFKLSNRQYQTLLGYVKSNFSKQTADRRKESEELQKQIGILEDNQSKLLEKNLSGVINDSILQQHLTYIDKKLMETHARLARLPKQEKNLETVLRFAGEFLKSPGTIWEKLPFANKLALQRFNFPQGVTFDGNKFRTTQISNIFKGNYHFSDTLSLKADLSIKTLNHQLPQENLSEVKKNQENNLKFHKRRIIKNRPSIPKPRPLFEVDVTKWKSKVNKQGMVVESWDAYLEELNELVDILEVEPVQYHEKENALTLLQ